tara:strand:+ start:826 stop:2757 length:1932 start_codon:yes stop_codon:yes gene_type:complete
MALLRQFYTNFTAGEISPLLSSRVDSDAYRNGVKTLENFRMRAQGGVIRRPGLRYLQTLSNTTYQTEPYIYDADEAYILIFSNTQIDIVDFSDPTNILQTLTSQKWTTAMIGQLKVAQSADTMIVVHPDMEMQKITRTSASNFTVTDYAFDSSNNFIHQPYYKFVAESITLKPQSANTGSQTITASSAIFDSSWVGEEVEFTDSNDVVHHVGITAYLSSTTVTGTFDTAPANTTARTTWKEQVFSTRRGYARSVIFHDQRLVFGGSKSLPNHLFFSQVGEYFNFDPGTGLDNESIQVQIAENQISEIKSLASFRHLAIFTSESELYVPTVDERPLTPSTITIKRQSSFGTGNVQPKEFDSAILFITRSKGSIREFIFSDLSQAYESDAITILAGHLVGEPTDMEVQREASDQVESYLYAINSDGDLPVFVSIRKEKLQGWCKYTTEGSFKNIVNVNRRIFAIVERTIDGSTETRLELFDNNYHLDSASKYTSGSPTASWTVSHLPNTNVYVKSGNYSLGQFTTDASGNITLSDLVDEIEVGINYTPTLTTLPAEFQLQDGVSVGQKRRVVRALLDLNESLNVQIQGTNLLIRRVTSNLSLAPDAITEKKEVYLLGWGREGNITVSQDQPLPLAINGVLVEVEV